MRIYTRTGDDGTTGLAGGGRVSKTDLRIWAIGDVDELNAVVGLAFVTAKEDAVRATLASIQDRLFELGAELASPEGSKRTYRLVESSAVEALEQSIDRMEAHLSPLRNFILPGGSESAARLHLARTVCRRAERSVRELCEKASVRDVIPTFLNRLSDWLFVAARTENRVQNVEDVPWKAEEI